VGSSFGLPFIVSSNEFLEQEMGARISQFLHGGTADGFKLFFLWDPLFGFSEIPNRACVTHPHQFVYMTHFRCD